MTSFEARLERQRVWRFENRERLAAKRREWYAMNRERGVAATQRWRERKRKEAGWKRQKGWPEDKIETLRKLRLVDCLSHRQCTLKMGCSKATIERALCKYQIGDPPIPVKRGVRPKAFSGAMRRETPQQARMWVELLAAAR